MERLTWRVATVTGVVDETSHARTLVLDDDDDLADGDALEFFSSAFRHACVDCDWDPALLASAEGSPPPVA